METSDLYRDPYYPSFAIAVEEMVSIDFDHPPPYLDLDFYMRQLDAALAMLSEGRAHPVAQLARKVHDANPVIFEQATNFQDKTFRAAVSELKRVARQLDIDRIPEPPGDGHMRDWMQRFLQAVDTAAAPEINAGSTAMLGVDYEEEWSTLRYLSAWKRDPADVAAEAWAAARTRPQVVQ